MRDIADARIRKIPGILRTFRNEKEKTKMRNESTMETSKERRIVLGRAASIYLVSARLFYLVTRLAVSYDDKM